MSATKRPEVVEDLPVGLRGVELLSFNLRTIVEHGDVDTVAWLHNVSKMAKGRGLIEHRADGVQSFHVPLPEAVVEENLDTAQAVWDVENRQAMVVRGENPL
ncbi:MAG: hypothetical protein LBE25_13635 [Arthrobacter sp.]|nr:hypothetical protein [Arthrobacter sp.]